MQETSITPEMENPLDAQQLNAVLDEAMHELKEPDRNAILLRFFERRQFANSYDELSSDAAELARAIDGYKVQHRRRFVTFEEMLGVIKSLGYSK